ncbi:MAG: hypothetical protein Q3Y08_00560 [Butyricicoccus sp.]|nr:hypothetical protein [Butyricicoccus sp.]
MGKRSMTEERLTWAAWLTGGVSVWVACAVVVSSYLARWSGAPGRGQCIASGVYVAVLIGVMAVGNFARVRTLLTLEVLYGIGVFVRSVAGTVCALMFLELEEIPSWIAWLDLLTRPLYGLQYVAAQLTSHFITEIYWLGLALGATILVFLSCVARMAVTNRIARAREER